MPDTMPPEFRRRFARGDPSTLEHDFLAVYLSHLPGVDPLDLTAHFKRVREAEFAFVVGDLKKKIFVAADILRWLEWEWPAEKQTPPYKFAQSLRDRAELARSLARQTLGAEPTVRYQLWGFQSLREGTELALASLGDVPGVSIELIVGPKAFEAVRRVGRMFVLEGSSPTNNFLKAVWLLEKAGWKPPRDA